MDARISDDKILQTTNESDLYDKPSNVLLEDAPPSP